jgi:hypothetical protein
MQSSYLLEGLLLQLLLVLLGAYKTDHHRHRQNHQTLLVF